jgi:hypothetical protein
LTAATLNTIVLSPDKDETKLDLHKRLDSRIFNSPNFATCGKDLIVYEESQFLQGDSELKLNAVQVITAPHSDDLRSKKFKKNRSVVETDLTSPPTRKAAESYIIRRKVVY